MMSELVTARHLARRAVIYIRQSTPQQVLGNQESLRLQYALCRRAQDLGWPDAGIEVIDSDLGRSGATAMQREGFKDLIARVTLGEVGIVLSYEVTRLARNCSDWYPLLDLCGYRQCLIGDRDGVYDPGSANGRLLLGLKGMISEVELHTLRGRLTAGLLSKAERGELALLLPAGLVRGMHGVVTKHPDREVQERIGLVFASFLELGSVGKVLRSFRGRTLAVPQLDRFGEVVWRTPTDGMIAAILKNPAYAGAFVYGRTRSRQAIYASGKLITMRCPMAEWKVVVKDRYPAYVGWADFERIQAMLRDNHAEYARNQTRGVPRDGAALLQGSVWCGRCGHKMTVEYKAANRYVCNFLQRSQGGPLCQHFPADPIDARVVAAFFAAASPEELDAWARAQDTRRQVEDALDRAEAQQVERLRYQALLAERQFNRVDPDNRLVASELEHRWEATLRELRRAEEALVLHRASRTQPDALTPEERDGFLALGPQLPATWRQPGMDRAHKKALLRCLIEKVVLHRTAPERIGIRIVWRGGEVSEEQVEPRVYALHALSRGADMQARILELARQGLADAEAAEVLTGEGYRSPRASRVLARTVQVFRQRHRVLPPRRHRPHDPGPSALRPGRRRPRRPPARPRSGVPDQPGALRQQAAHATRQTNRRLDQPAHAEQPRLIAVPHAGAAVEAPHALPRDWTLDLALVYVRHVDQSCIGDFHRLPRLETRAGEPMAPNTKKGMLSAVRVFFHQLQEWGWIERRLNPSRAFLTPRQVTRAAQYNPRPIDDGHWLKLRAAALALQREDLPLLSGVRKTYQYPLELARAVAATWVFSGCRANEIERLEVGCTYIEHVPEQNDPATGEMLPAFDQAMLRVPVSKTSGEFVKPIEEPIARAIAAWEQVRPTQRRLLDPITGRLNHPLFCYRGQRIGRGFVNRVLIPVLLRKAGLPPEDTRGAITSHRARATMATKLYSSSSGLTPLEVMRWLGHKRLASGQHYIALTPTKLMTAFHKSSKLTETLRTVAVLVDGRPEPGRPVLRYDLGHGWCTNPAYAMCAHRMACARCSFYEPAAAFANTLAQQKGRYVQMLQQLDLTDDERAAVTGDADACERLVSRLAKQPTPDGASASESLK